jgi:ribonuclease P protein component
MLARKYRFRGHNSVSRVRSKPIRLSGVTAYVVPTRRSFSRVAIVVSKKVSKSAVVRNRIRRRIYESIRLSGLVDNGTFDMVVIVHNPALATTGSIEIFKMIEKLRISIPKQ